MTIDVELKRGEYVMEVNDLNGSLAFGQVWDGQGQPSLAPDGICVATAALHLDRNAAWVGEIGEGARFVVYRSPSVVIHLLRKHRQMHHARQAPGRSGERANLSLSSPLEVR